MSSLGPTKKLADRRGPDVGLSLDQLGVRCPGCRRNNRNGASAGRAAAWAKRQELVLRIVEIIVRACTSRVGNDADLGSSVRMQNREASGDSHRSWLSFIRTDLIATVAKEDQGSVGRLAAVNTSR